MREEDVLQNADCRHFVLGLSPRVRGNLDRIGENHNWWSIPACTGEPTNLIPRQRPRGVYPRVYGGT